MIVLFFGCVFCYWMYRSDVSVIPFRMCLPFIIVFGLVVMVFYLSLPVRGKFSCQMISGTVSWLLGLGRIFK